jgi:hypothetical protein
MELDLEDFIEEVKFQMLEYEILSEEKILDWEEKVRIWIQNHKDKRAITYKNSDDIIIKIRNLDIMTELALKYYKAVKYNQVGDYWKRFNI